MNLEEIQEKANELIGMTEVEAIAHLIEHDLKLRTVRVDGEPLMVTMDFDHERINVFTEDGLISEFNSIG